MRREAKRLSVGVKRSGKRFALPHGDTLGTCRDGDLLTGLTGARLAPTLARARGLLLPLAADGAQADEASEADGGGAGLGDDGADLEIIGPGAVFTTGQTCAGANEGI